MHGNESHSSALRTHQNRFRLGLCPGSRWGSSRRSPRPPSQLGRGYPSPYPTTSALLVPRSSDHTGTFFFPFQALVVSKIMSWFRWLLLVVCICHVHTFCLFFFLFSSDLQNDLLCVEWDVQLCSNSYSLPLIHREIHAADSALSYHTTLSLLLQVIFNVTISFSSALFCVCVF